MPVMPAQAPTIWNREFHPTRLTVHVLFAAIIWPFLTVTSATFAIVDLAYISSSLTDALLAVLGGLLLSSADMLVAGAMVFGLSGLIFRSFGCDIARHPGVLRLGLEPLLMFVAVMAGAVLWYPGTAGQPLLWPLRAVPVGGIVLLLMSAVILGAVVAAKPGRRTKLACVLVLVALLCPVPVAARAALEPFMGHAPDAVVLGVDSVSFDNPHAQFEGWVKQRGGTWYERAVAPALMTNAVWTSILTLQPVRTHGVFHTFQAFPPGVPPLLASARAHGYRTVSVFPDQLTAAPGSRAGFDEDRSGPVGWRQLVLSTVLNYSVLGPIVKPALPRWWPSPAAPNQAGTFTYDVRREIRGILRAGSGGQRTLVMAHLTYTHLDAYPSLRDLSWAEIWAIARTPARSVRDRSFDWQDIDRPTDALPLHAWKMRHVHRVIADEVDAAGYLRDGRRLVVFSDHGDRYGLSFATFGRPRYYHVPLATFGIPARCPGAPTSLIDIGSLLGLSDVREVPSVEFALAPPGAWAALARGAQLRWSGDVELDRGALAAIFSGIKRHDPWPDLVQRGCTPAATGP
jgi:hypothetical protein